MTMIDALNNFVSRPVVGLILSALVGAAFGYGAAVIQSAQEAAAKQDVLIHALVDELKTISESVPPYQVEKAFYRDPIRLSSPALLLNGEVLDYKSHASIIRLLLQLHVSISKYNDFVQITNAAQAAVLPIPDNIHGTWYTTMKDLHAAVTQTKNQLLEEMAKSRLTQ